MNPAPGWYPDPWSTELARYWNGTGWTANVGPRPDRALNAGRVPPPPPPHPTLPVWVAIGSVLSLIVPLIASRFILRAVVHHTDWPVFSYMVINAVIGYLPAMLWWGWVVRRLGATWRGSVGLFARWKDLLRGPLVYLCCLAVEIGVVRVILLLRIPIVSNLDDRSFVVADRSYVVALIVVAVAVAPIVEEILFRGLILRGLLSSMNQRQAIAVQGVMFGMAHFDPQRGRGNIGLIMLLTAVGVVLGVAACRLRRLTPGIIAHAIINAIAMVVVISRTDLL